MYLVEGYNNPQIALHLNKAVDTVKKQVVRLFDKTHCGNRIELVNWYRDLLEKENSIARSAPQCPEPPPRS